MSFLENYKRFVIYNEQPSLLKTEYDKMDYNANSGPIKTQTNRKNYMSNKFLIFFYINLIFT